MLLLNLLRGKRQSTAYESILQLIAIVVNDLAEIIGNYRRIFYQNALFLTLLPRFALSWQRLRQFFGWPTVTETRKIT